MVTFSLYKFQRWIVDKSNYSNFLWIPLLLNSGIIICVFFTSCKKDDRITDNNHSYFFELVDSVKIDIPYEFGLVFPKAIDSQLLAYSYLDQTFHVLDSLGRLQYSINHQGEGPKEYTGILPFVTIYDGHLIFMDDKKLTYFNYNGDWVKSVPYHDPNVTRRGGMPYNDLTFIGQNKFVIPNIHLDDLSRRPDHQSVLDTVPIWLLYEYSDVSNKYEIADYGRLDTASILFSDLKYTSYSPRTYVKDGYVNLFFNLSPTIYMYRIGESNYPIDTKKIDIPGFKEPIGLDFKSMNHDNFMEFNRASDINSHLNYVVSLENDLIFFIYSQGKNIGMHDSEADANESPEPLFFGYVYDFYSGVGNQIGLPKHHGHPSFWNKVTYLGNKKFLFVFENEVERDFYWGKIFELKYSNQ
jgi:hypothetical protein